MKKSMLVFLCHSSKDKPAVRELHKQLLTDGVDVWLDEERLIPGQDWKLEIPKAVRESDVVIVCLSRDSVNKEGYIQKEIKFALDIADEKPEGTIFIIPAKLEECNVPERLKSRQWVNLFEPNGYQKLLGALEIRSRDIGAKINITNGLNNATAGSSHQAASISEVNESATNLSQGDISRFAQIENVLDFPIPITTVLAQAIVEQGRQHINKGINPFLIKAGLEKALLIATNKIKESAKALTTIDEVIALVRTGIDDPDGSISQQVAKAFEKVGVSGVVIVEESKTLRHELDYVEGGRLESGFISPYFSEKSAIKDEVSIYDPYIILCEKEILHAATFVPLLEKIVGHGKKACVFIAKDVTGEGLATLILNSLRGFLDVVAIKAPAPDQLMNDILQDISILTGAKVFRDEGELHNATLARLYPNGTCKSAGDEREKR